MVASMFLELPCCVEDGQTDDLAFFISDNDIVLGQLRVVGVAGFFKVDIEDVRLFVVGCPKALLWQFQKPRDQRHDLPYFFVFHNTVLRLNCCGRDVRNAVIKNPSSALISR